MKITLKDLQQLPVKTQRGIMLGRIVGIDFDTEAHAVVKYHVARFSVVDELLRRTLLVDPSQVISITSKEVTVEDAILPDATKALGINVA